MTLLTRSLSAGSRHSEDALVWPNRLQFELSGAAFIVTLEGLRGTK